MAQRSRVDLDTVLRALADVQRRRLLVALLEDHPQEDSIRVTEDSRLAEQERQRLQMEMFHTHLPKLEDRGFIRWDREEHQVEKGPTFSEIRPLLELLHNNREKLPEGWK